MRHREIVGPVNLGASIIQKLVEAVEDAGGQEADLINVAMRPGLELRAIGESIFDKSNTFSVSCAGGRSPRNFALEMGLRIDGALEIDDLCLVAIEFPLGTVVRIKLVRPNIELSMIEAEQHLKELGLRPATLIEILYLIEHCGKSLDHKLNPHNPLIVLGERRISEGREMFITVSTTWICVLRLPGECHRNEKQDKNTFWAGVEIDKQ